MEQTSCQLAKKAKNREKSKRRMRKRIASANGNAMKRWQRQMRDVVIREHDSGGIITDTG